MIGLFSAKPPVPRDEYEWLVACFAWLRTVLDDADIRPALVCPSDQRLQAASTGEELFDAVRQIADMGDWSCRLEMVPEDFDPGDGQLEHESTSACGTFSIEGGEAVIRYSANMLRNPDALAATFAHELCHFLLAGAGDPPGGPDLMEHSTDCAAAYLGFGILLANSARTFETWGDGQFSGWRHSTAGYLSEPALVTATALFAQLHGHSLDAARGELKPYLRRDLDKANKAVARDFPDLADHLKTVDLLDWQFA